MQCAICRGSGPFAFEACVLDESRPMCDKCAAAVDTIYDNEDNFDEWKESYFWLLSVKDEIQDSKVSSFVRDVLNEGKTKANYQKIESSIIAKENAARKAAEAVLREAEVRHDAEVAPYNAVYEYAVESIPDNPDGSADTALIGKIISQYASKGWRLHQTMVNEIGRTSESSGMGGIMKGTNATIEQTILIFERCVKPLKRE